MPGRGSGETLARCTWQRSAHPSLSGVSQTPRSPLRSQSEDTRAHSANTNESTGCYFHQISIKHEQHEMYLHALQQLEQKQKAFAARVVGALLLAVARERLSGHASNPIVFIKLR